MAISNIFKTKYDEWKGQWQDKRVQESGLSTHDFVSAASTLLVSGPANWVGKDNNLIPVGLVQNANISQNKQIQQLHEIGSRQLFTVPGRTFVQCGIARILFDGPSILFALHSEYNDAASDVMISTMPTGTDPGDLPTVPYKLGVPADKMSATDLGPKELNGYWGNLGSSMFNKPMGLGFIFMDTESDFYGGIYLEECYIQSYNMGISAQQTILLENVQVRATRITPIEVST